MKRAGILPFLRVTRNELPGNRLRELGLEAARGEVAGGRHGPSPPGGDPLGPDRFRLQPGDRSLGSRRADALPLEIRPDRGVAVAPAGERLGAAGREPAVVEDPGPLEGLDRLRAGGGGYRAAGEPLVEGLRGEVSEAECTAGCPERLAPPQGPREVTCGRPVELPAEDHARSHHGVHRQRPPGRFVELDLDAAALQLA